MDKYTVFVASPSDVNKERNTLSKIIDEVNLTHGTQLGYELSLWRYEENAFPSASKPQDLINSIIKPYQIFIGIMWKYFGTPTTTAGSGTEEEYKIAFKAWQQKEVIDIMFYFCKKPYLPKNLQEHKQFGKVLKFKNQMNGNSFIWDYTNPNDFKDKIRKHLCLLMNNEIEKKKNPKKIKSMPDEDTLKVFKNTWNKMSPELQHYLSVPYNENRMKGDAGIQTRDLFAAMVTNPTPELQAIMKHIPSNALPGSFEGKIIDDTYIVNEKPWLSHCISSSIKRLSKILPANQQLTALDVFIDIAKNGSGESVRLLRQNNINAKDIEAFLKMEKLNVLLS